MDLLPCAFAGRDSVCSSCFLMWYGLQKCDMWEQRIPVVTALCVHLSGLEFSGMYWCCLPGCFSLALNSVISWLYLLQVQQEEVTEIDILVKDLRVLRHSNYTVPLKESMLYSMPRDNDVLFTLPNLSGKGISQLLSSIFIHIQCIALQGKRASFIPCFT